MKNSFTTNARWIGSGEGGFKTGEFSPATELRYTFTLEKAPKSAECLISGLGFYTLYINGKRVGDDVLSPAFTNYDKTVLYLRYDLKDYLEAGENVIAVKLGDGFYNQAVADEWNFYLASWRNLPRLLFELFIDGKSAVCSGKGWRIRRSGATVQSSVRCGEYYDARLADGWREKGYSDAAWDEARLVASPGGVLTEMLMPPCRECEAISPVNVWKTKNGWLYDFGKCMAGYVGIRASAPVGTTATLRYSDIIKDGELDQSQINIFIYDDIPFSTDKYTFSGEGVEEWRPEFVYHGFRYVEFLWDSDEVPPRDALTAYFVHTDFEMKGSFECSDELLCWIYGAGVRSFLSNYHGFPTDCPHREKNGWTGDAVISADYATFLYDMTSSYKKWIHDIIDAQRINGQFPGIVPTGGWGYNWGSGPAWDFALFALPYVNYLETGSTEMLADITETAEKYLAYAKTREDEDGLVCYGLSDWCPPKRIDSLNIADNRMTDSCYYYAMHGIMARIYEILGKDSSLAAKHLDKAHEIKAKIKKIFYTDADLGTFGQGALAFLLYYNIVEGEEAEAVAKRLAELVRSEGYVHKVGILGLKALENALSQYGYTDVAYKMLTRTDYPSYGYWRSLGETSLPETWEENDQSRIHHMYADAVNWMIRNVAGIRNCGVAYDKAEFKPYIFDKTCSAAASTKTPRGEIGISWSYEDGRFSADIKLPEGTYATLTLGEKSYPVITGKFEITL